MLRNTILLWAILGLALLWTALLSAQPRSPAVTRTQRIELVDRDNRVRAELKVSGEETLLVLYDGQGRLRTVVDIQGVTFYSEDGKVRRRVTAEGQE